MEDLKKQHLNETLSSNGWLLIRAKIDEKMARLDSLDTIDDKLSPEQITAQIKGNKEARRIIKELFSEINSMAKLEKLSKKEML